LEEEFSERSATSSDPGVAFMDFLIEDYASA
jgi:hypothetical protein